MTDIFMSYARENIEFVRRLFQRLQKDERGVWVDWESIPRGEDWLSEIYKGIEQADTFAFVVSKYSLTSEVCNQELHHAIENNKRVVPLIRETIEDEVLIWVRGTWVDKPWEEIARDNWDRLRALNWLFFRDHDDFDAEYQALIEAINTDQTHIKEHTRLLVKAHEWAINKRNASFLLRGLELREAERWLTQAGGKDPKPDELHTEYILASRQTTDRRQRALLGVTGLALAVVTLLAILSSSLFRQSELNLSIALTNEANKLLAQAIAERRAQESLSLFLAASAAQETDLSLALPLALAAVGIPQPPIQAQETLAQVAYAPGLQRKLAGHEGSIGFVGFSPNGKTALTASSYGELALWNTSTWELVSTLSRQNLTVESLALSRDSTAVLSIWDDASALLWNSASGEETIFPDYRADIESHSQDTTLLLSTMPDDSIVLIDAETRDVIQDFTAAESVDSDEWATVFATSPDGTVRLTGECGFIGENGCERSELRVYDLINGAALHRFHIHDSAVTALAVGSGGRTMLSSAADGSLVLWDPTMGSIICRLSGHREPVNDVAISRDGQTALSSSETQLIVWDLNTCEQRRPIETVHNVAGVAFALDDTTAVSGYGRAVMLWDLQTGQARLQLGPVALPSTTALAISPDGETVFAGGCNASDDILFCTNGILRSFNAANGEPTDDLIISPVEGNFSVFQDAAITSLAFNSDGTQAVSGGCAQLQTTVCVQGEVILWDLIGHTQIRRFAGHVGRVVSVAISPDGKTILSGGANSVILWDIATGEALRRYDAGQMVTNVAFSPDGNLAFSSTSDGTITLWRVDTLEELLDWINTHRVVRTLTCREREQFRVEPLCAGGENPVPETTSTSMPG